MWGQYVKSIKTWLQCIRNERIQAPGLPTILTVHHPPNLEASTLPTKKSSYKYWTRLDFLPLEILHNFYMWHVGFLHCNQLKPVFLWLTEHHPVLCVSTSYELKFNPFDYNTHYDHIKYAWAYRRKGPHIPIYKWV